RAQRHMLVSKWHSNHQRLRRSPAPAESANPQQHTDTRIDLFESHQDTFRTGSPAPLPPDESHNSATKRLLLRAWHSRVHCENDSLERSKPALYRHLYLWNWSWFNSFSSSAWAT